MGPYDDVSVNGAVSPAFHDEEETGGETYEDEGVPLEGGEDEGDE